MKNIPNLFLETYRKTPEKEKEIDDVCDYLYELYYVFKTTYNEWIKLSPILSNSSKSIHYRPVMAFGRDAATEHGRTWVDGEFIYLGTETNYGDGDTDRGTELKLTLSNIFGVSELQAKEYVRELAITEFAERMENAEMRIALEKAKNKERVERNQQRQLEEARKLLEKNGYSITGDNK